LGGVIGTAILGYYIWGRIFNPPTHSPADLPLAKPSFKAHSDRGETRIDPEDTLDVVAEISLRAVADPGVQQSEENSPQILKEELEK
jgi:hypothetical protein